MPCFKSLHFVLGSTLDSTLFFVILNFERFFLSYVKSCQADLPYPKTVIMRKETKWSAQYHRFDNFEIQPLKSHVAGSPKEMYWRVKPLQSSW